MIRPQTEMQAVPDRTSGPNTWNTRMVALWVTFAALFLVNYWPTFKWMIWRFEETNSYSTHGYLIPFISAWLVWSRRGQWLPLPARPSSWGIPVILLSLFVHLVSGLADISSISGFTIPLLISGFLVLTLGWSYLRELWFPIIFLFFMVPLPDFIISGLNFRLKFMASDVAAFLLNATGLVAIREGSFMLFGSEKLAIGDVCSGLRSLLSLVALGVLYAYMIRDKSKANVYATLAAIVPAAIIGNGLRICLVAYLVFWLGSDTVFKPIMGEYDLHLFTGLIIFAGAFGVLWGVNALVDWVKERKGATAK